MNLIAFIKQFGTDEACRTHMESVRWPNGPVCPKCGSINQAAPVGRRPGVFRCKACSNQFTVTVGTAMEGTHLGLNVWYLAIKLLGPNGDGLSTVKLGERLGIKQKTAWSLARRVRTMAEARDPLVLSIAAVQAQPPLLRAVSQERIRELLSYSPETGAFIWIGRADKGMPGKAAGCPNKKGYLRITIDRRSYYAHRLAFLYMTGTFPEKVDHRDCDTSNNRWENLRAATETQNHANSPKRIRTKATSPLKGVCWYARVRKWYAQISVGGKNLSLGYFATEAEAHEAYAAAAQCHFGGFARLS